MCGLFVSWVADEQWFFDFYFFVAIFNIFCKILKQNLTPAKNSMVAAMATKGEGQYFTRCAEVQEDPCWVTKNSKLQTTCDLILPRTREHCVFGRAEKLSVNLKIGTKQLFCFWVDECLLRDGNPPSRYCITI